MYDVSVEPPTESQPATNALVSVTVTGSASPAVVTAVPIRPPLDSKLLRPNAKVEADETTMLAPSDM